MTKFLYFRAWYFIGIVLIVIVIYLTLTSNPVPIPKIEFGDKISHLFAYATLSGWFAQLYSRFSVQVKFCVAFCLMGIALEFLQGLGGVRMFEYADMVANALGALLGLVLSRTWFKGALVKVDRFLAANF